MKPSVVQGDTVESDIELAFDRVLVAVDASEPARAALRVSLSLAKRYHATLILCHVVSSTEAFSKAEVEENDAAGFALLDSAVKSAEINDVVSEARLLHGEAVQQVLQVVSDVQANLVVVGTHARKGVARFYLGSVAEGILRSASVPVLVVKAPLLGSV